MDRLLKLLDAVRAELDAPAAARGSIDEARRARAFLASLDPESSEGMWFDAIAESFPTRLDAAIAYLRDVKR